MQRQAIRSPSEQDNFSNIKPFDVISYSSGNHHLYNDYFVTRITEKGAVCVPFTPRAPNPEKFNDHFSVRMHDDVNNYMNKTMKSNSTMYLRPTEINVISKDEYQKSGGLRQFNITDLTDTATAIDITQRINTRVATIARDYARTLTGTPTHVTTDDLKHHLIGKFLGVDTKLDHNQYVPTTKESNKYRMREANEHKFKPDTPYANVDKLKPLTVVRYKANTGETVKWRPFLVEKVSKDSAHLVPITHSLPGSSKFAVYHSEVPRSIAKQISLMCGDSNEQAQRNRTALAPANAVDVKFSEFKKKQLPEYLGNLTQSAPQADLNQMLADSQKTMRQLDQAYNKYQDLKKSNKPIHNFYKRYMNRDLIDDKYLSYLEVGRKYNLPKMRTPIDNLKPISEPEL